MPGEVIKRGKGVWLVRAFLGRDEYGKRHFENKTIHGNKKDAEGELTKLYRARDTGKLTLGGQKLTISILLDGVRRTTSSRAGSPPTGPN